LNGCKVHGRIIISKQISVKDDFDADLFAELMPHAVVRLLLLDIV
jgi:hypothetical protein